MRDKDGGSAKSAGGRGGRGAGKGAGALALGVALADEAAHVLHEEVDRRGLGAHAEAHRTVLLARPLPHLWSGRVAALVEAVLAQARAAVRQRVARVGVGVDDAPPLAVRHVQAVLPLRQRLVPLALPLLVRGSLRGLIWSGRPRLLGRSAPHPQQTPRHAQRAPDAPPGPLHSTGSDLVRVFCLFPREPLPLQHPRPTPGQRQLRHGASLEPRALEHACACLLLRKALCRNRVSCGIRCKRGEHCQNHAEPDTGAHAPADSGALPPLLNKRSATPGNSDLFCEVRRRRAWGAAGRGAPLREGPGVLGSRAWESRRTAGATAAESCRGRGSPFLCATLKSCAPH